MIRPLLLCWAGLLALLAATAGLTLLPLGAAAMPAALVIALAMAVGVALVCMRLGPAPRLAMVFVIGAVRPALITRSLFRSWVPSDFRSVRFGKVRELFARTGHAFPSTISSGLLRSLAEKPK